MLFYFSLLKCLLMYLSYEYIFLFKEFVLEFAYHFIDFLLLIQEIQIFLFCNNFLDLWILLSLANPQIKICNIFIAIFQLLL